MSFYVFAGLDETYKIQHLASRLIRALNDEVKYPDGIRGVRACIGIAVAPACGTGVASLYDKADKALYYSKNHGKNTYHFTIMKSLTAMKTRCARRILTI